MPPLRPPCRHAAEFADYYYADMKIFISFSAMASCISWPATPLRHASHSWPDSFRHAPLRQPMPAILFYAIIDAITPFTLSFHYYARFRFHFISRHADASRHFRCHCFLCFSPAAASLSLLRQRFMTPLLPFH
jgi:hypothetical protein